MGCRVVSGRARGADARADAGPKRRRCGLGRRAAQATTTAGDAGGRPVPTVRRGPLFPGSAGTDAGSSTMRVAAYQCPLLPLGSMGAIELMRRQVKACESQGISILCGPEAVLGGLAD